jgi:mono/diheme cytochrome c family protein
MEKDHLHHHHYEKFAKVPEKARAKSNPLAEDPDPPVAGKKLFEQHCAECHGNTAEGGREEGRPRVYAPRKSKRRHPAHFSGSSPTEWSAGACPSGPSCLNRSAGRL